MTIYLTTAILGLGAGALIALSASGLVLVFRSSGVINFAHGAIGMVGSYAFYELAVEGSWPVWPAVAASVLVSAILGALTFVATVVAPRGASVLTQSIGTVAVMLILQAGASLRYGQNASTVSQFLPSGQTTLGDLTISHDRLTILLAAIAITVVTTVVYRRTRFGIATAAVAENPRNLAALGWRVTTLRAVNWAIGGGLAGLALTLTSPISGISTIGGTLLIVPTLAAALIGSLRSFPLTLAGGLLIGILQAHFARDDFGIPGLVDAVPFAIIVVLLLTRGSSLPLRSEVGARLPRIGSGRVPVVPLVLVSGLLTAWMFTSAPPELTLAITTTLLFAIPVLSLTIVLGYAGQLSLAQLTLAGVGALFAARLMADRGFGFLPAVFLGALLTVPVGLLVGIPSVRTRGISLAVATLGLSVAIQSLVFGNQDISNGTDGILISPDGSPLSILGWEIDPLFTPERYGLVALVGFVGCALILTNFRRGRSGRRLIAVRSNERAAAALGIGVSSAKLWAFGIGSAIAGFGGALMALRFPAVLFDQFGVFNNISAIAIAVFGGAGSVVGAAVGAAIAPAGLAEYIMEQLATGWARYIALIGGVSLLLTIISFRDGVAMALSDGTALVARRLGPIARILMAGPGSRSATELVNDARTEAVSFVRPAALSVEDVSVAFGGVQALQHVSLRIEPGQVLGLIGPNGAGKTTFVDAVTGFAPSTGTVRLGDDVMPPRRPHLRARAGISRSFQSLELFEDLSVFDNLRTASDPRDQRSYLFDLVRPRRGALSSETVAAIDRFDLRQVLDHLPMQLTFGQRRLVSMARSIASAPSVLLLDEPCAGLDETERAETAAIIRQMASEHGMAVLLVEHDVNLVRQVCDELVVLDFGKVIASGAPDDVLADPRVVDAYLGAEVVWDAEALEATEVTA